MKKVVKESEITVTLSDIHNNSVIGIYSVSTGKGLVSKNHNGYFEYIRTNSISANQSPEPFNSKYGLVEYYLKQGKDIYVFDSVKELYKWLAE